MGGAGGRIVQRHGERLIDRREQAGAIGGEILRRASIAERAGEHHRGQIVRAELINRDARDPLREDLIFDSDRPIEHDHDEPSLRLDAVDGDVRRHIAHPRRGGRRGLWFRDIDGHERDDRTGLAVFENREVRRRQPANRFAVSVENGDINLDDFDARAKRRCGLLVRESRKRKDSDQRSGSDAHQGAE